MSQEQLATYLQTAFALWPVAGLGLGMLLTLASGIRRSLVGQATGLVLTAISLGVLVARL